MYSTLKSREIGEEKSREAGDRINPHRSKIGDKCLSQVLFGDTYGNSKANPRFRIYQGSRKDSMT